jgi:hypothetical protein
LTISDVPCQAGLKQANDLKKRDRSLKTRSKTDREGRRHGGAAGLCGGLAQREEERSRELPRANRALRRAWSKSPIFAAGPILASRFAADGEARVLDASAKDTRHHVNDLFARLRAIEEAPGKIPKAQTEGVEHGEETSFGRDVFCGIRRDQRRLRRHDLDDRHSQQWRHDPDAEADGRFHQS